MSSHFVRDAFVLCFVILAGAGLFAVVSATIQSWFTRTPLQDLTGSAPRPANGQASAAFAAADATRGPSHVTPIPLNYERVIYTTPSGVAAAQVHDLADVLLDEALRRQGIDPDAFRRAKADAIRQAQPIAPSAVAQAQTQAIDADYWDVASERAQPAHDPTV